jgi:type IV pilus assembly protein PilE
MKRNRRSIRGLTLVELLVTIAVISILAAIGYPAYTSYTSKARRTEATGALLDFATRMERYYADNNSYAGATVDNIMGGASTEHGYYTLSVVLSNGNQSYTLSAARAGAQANDDCGTFSLNSLGAKSVSGTGTCW